MQSKKFIVLSVHAFIGWLLCAAVMGIGMALISLESTLIIHAFAAPTFFILISLVYFKRFSHTSPLFTAVFFVGFVMVVDFFIVALLINKSLDMFTSILGTWLPFSLIFLSTLITGKVLNSNKSSD